MSTVFGSISVETPKFSILKSYLQCEIRIYESCILATTKTNSWSENGAFRRLANYIFGNEEKKISMTAPVISTSNTMSFVLPSKYKLTDLPQPQEQVELKERPELVLAVRKFTWTASDSNVQVNKVILERELQKEGVKYKPNLYVFQYNPPWCIPFLRTNEVALEVENVNTLN
jgi:hypothetical protein